MGLHLVLLSRRASQACLSMCITDTLLLMQEAEGPQAVACFLPVRRSFLPSWAYVSLAAMQAGLALLVASRKLKPSIGERFMTFVR